MGETNSSVARAALERSGAGLGLTRQEWDNVLLFAKWRTMAPDEVLFAQGAPGDSLALVVVGEFSVRVRSGGGDREIMCLAPGDLIGEMACIDPGPRSATVVALTHAQLVTLDRTAFLVMIEHLPRVASRITNLIIDRVNARLFEIDHQLDERIGATTGEPPPAPPARDEHAPVTDSASPRLSWWRSFLNRVQGAE